MNSWPLRWNGMAREAMLLVGCSLLILVPVLVNGFPIVFSDTGTYLRSAFEGLVPADRPYWYGGFIRATSFGGAWITGVVVAQALLCAIYLNAVMALSLGRSERWRVMPLFCGVAGPLTGLGWYAGQLMPDVLTPIGAMAMLLLLRGDRSWAERTAHVLIITLCAWCHSSNLLILPLVGIGVIAALAGRSWQAWRRLLPRWGFVTACSWVGLYLANGFIDGKPYLSRGSHVFLLGRLVDTGMLEPLLREECPTHQWTLCAYVDSLPPTGRQFLWSEKSPLNRMGGWDATRSEYGAVARTSFNSPQRVWSHMKASAASTVDQLTRWHLGYEIESHWYRDPGSPPAAMIAAHLPQALPAFNGAMQQGGRGELALGWPNIGYRTLLAVSLVLLFAWRWKRSRAGWKEEGPLITMALSAVVAGAWVCASLSEVDARYLARVSWLLPLSASVVMARWRPVHS